MSELRARLEAAVLAAMDRACAGPARWGTDDCALWCADVLQDALGYDPAWRERGEYGDEEGARRLLGMVGLPFLLRRIARSRDWRSVSPENAEVGDIGVTHLAGHHGSTAVIYRARGWFVARTLDPGFIALPARDVRIAWSVV